LRTALILILGIVVVAVGIGVGALTITTRHYEANVSRIQNAFPTTGRPSTGPAAAGAVTFLVVAVERGPRAPARLVTDSVMLLRLTADDKHAEVVFLPVDLWLSPAGRPAATVGAMFRSGGSAELIAGVEGASGVRIDHYAQLDLDGFRTVTDAVGGVDVTIPRPYQAKGRAFTAGPQHLDGAAALAYVRATTVADHAQDAAREQLVMSALFARLGTIGALSDLGTMTRVVGAVSSALRVDSSLDDPGLVRLAWDHRGVGSPDFLSAPVSGRGVRGGQTVSLPDAARLSQLWAALRADDLAGHVGAFR
jgi:LCP family protein required for cell wall assembly